MSIRYQLLMDTNGEFCEEGHVDLWLERVFSVLVCFLPVSDIVRKKAAKWLIGWIFILYKHSFQRVLFLHWICNSQNKSPKQNTVKQQMVNYYRTLLSSSDYVSCVLWVIYVRAASTGNLRGLRTAIVV